MPAINEITDEEINDAFYQTGGNGWQVMRFVSDDGQLGYALFHETFQPDPTAGDISLFEMLRFAKELLTQAEIAITMGAHIHQDDAFSGNLADRAEGGAS